MTQKTFFEKFDLFADAPDAITKMRELVLELAIQGKLVAQVSDDEPASKQLERIAAKKLKTGRIARVKAGTGRSSAPEDTETHVPAGWEKTSLTALVTVLNGRAYSKDELLEAGMPVLRVGNLFTSKHWYYSDLELEPDKYCDKGDLIFAWSASFGPFIWPGPKVIYHYHIWKLELHSEVDLHKGYLYWFLQNKTQEIKRAGHGVSMLHMTKEKMEKLEVMLPPLAEQKRIVAKVDELMVLCDRLEAQQQERTTKHAALARASLARFADAPTPANLPFLFHPSYAIAPADLRKSILTLAVQGKLVPQGPNDEPAEVTFRGLKRLAPESGDRSDVPNQWALCTYRSLTTLVTSGSRGWKEFYAETGSIFVRTQNIKTDKLVLDDVAFVDLPKSAEGMRSQVLKDDILITITGANVTKAARVEKQIPEAYVSQHIALTRPRWSKMSEWLHLCFISNGSARGALEQLAYGDKPGLNLSNIRDLVLPIPPLAEQRRIVAKVSQLMALVDALETQLAASRATAANLLSALVTELTTCSL